MSDYIERQKAIDALRNAENHAFNAYYKGLVMAHKIIAELPSARPELKPADVVQAVHGKWTKEDRGHVEYCAVCDQCGFDWLWSDMCGEEWQDGRSKS